MKINEIILQRINKLLKDRKCTQTKLLAELNLNKGLLQSWATGSIPKVDKVLKIADYLEVSIDYLLGKTNFEICYDIINYNEERVSIIKRISSEQFTDEQCKNINEYINIADSFWE